MQLYVWIIEPSLSHAIELERLCRKLEYITNHVPNFKMVIEMLATDSLPDILIIDTNSVREEQDLTRIKSLRNLRIPTVFISNYGESSLHKFIPLHDYEAILIKPLTSITIESVFGLLLRSTSYINGTHL